MYTAVLNLNLRHLRAAAAIRRCGTISAGAAQVSLSQPAVTQGLASLESRLGLPLFHRRSSGMAPTQAGALLADRVEAAFTALADGFQMIRRSGDRGFVQGEQLLSMTHVRALLALAASGSFVGGASATGLSQPSLHRAVRDLERLSGTMLVERRGRGVALTAAGRRLSRAFTLAVAELQAGLDEIGVPQGRETGRVRVGAMPLARAQLLPAAIARLYRGNPAISVEIVEGPYDELLERLRDGTLDFLIGALREPNPGPDVTQTALFEDRLIVVAGNGHPLARSSPAVEKLALYPWIIGREGTPMHTHWQTLFKTHGMTPPASPVICGSVMAIRALLAKGEFLTLLSPTQVQSDVASGALVAISEPLAATARPIGLTTRSVWRPGPAQAKLIEELKLASSAVTLPLIE